MEEKGSKFGVRTSLEHFAEIERIKIIPLYAIGKIYSEDKKISLI
jgi:hypothetical protein